MIQRALLSVSDKRGLAEFARGLAGLGVEILSTGGTASLLAEAGVQVVPVSQVTGFPEILGGRVKTLHPMIHGGILARRDNPSHLKQLEELGIGPIDLVAVNLYPFRRTVETPGTTLEVALENIDIGGPTLVRAAAKNHPGVLVVVNPDRYGEILRRLQDGQDLDGQFRLELAAEAFRHTAAYDALIATHLTSLTGEGEDARFPAELTLTWEKASELRYGENPHQRAAFYRQVPPDPYSLAGATQLQGKELSFNNINDAYAALALVRELPSPAAVAVKHTNPCGVAQGDSVLQAYRLAHAADPVSIFGGVVAFNQVVDGDTAHALAEIFLEIVLAPGFTAKAREILGSKKNLRLLEIAPPPGGAGRWTGPLDLKRVSGGLLVQEADLPVANPDVWKTVTKRQPTAAELADLAFAWTVVKHVKSNAIVLAHAACTTGIGAGQMNRIDSARIAIEAAGDKAAVSVLASDAFFPFPDVVAAAAAAGVRAIAQPGGSIRDEESIRRADELGVSMVFTGVRHFRH